MRLLPQISLRFRILPALAAAVVGCLGGIGAHGAELTGTFSGSIGLPEISGAAPVGNRLLVIADDVVDEDDEVKRLHMIGLLDNALTRLKEQKPITVEASQHIYSSLLKKLGKTDADWELITDLEDIAIASPTELYAISSHSRSGKDKFPPKRQRLVKLTFDPSSGELKSAAMNQRNLVEFLPPELKKFTEPGQLPAATPPGFNIEGLAGGPEGSLWLGLRSPLREGKALVLQVERVASLFDAPSDPSAPSTIKVAAELDLGGMGIRGMCRDEGRNGYWLIAGIARDPAKPDPTLPNDWSIWFWDGKGCPQKKLEKSSLPKLENPEAITLVGGCNGSQLYILLISDDGAGENGAVKPSPYTLIPTEQLK